MDRKRKTAAKLMVECLEEEGVRYIFGIPGEENLELINAINNSDINFITTRHEQGAAFMADVYGRLTGKAGVCLSTLGPGATNLVTGVADAHSDGAPLVAITGQVGTERMHITSHQFLDLNKMFEPITKRSKLVVRPDTINEIVRIAFKYAETEKPGACHIDLPVNISKMEVSVEEKPLKRQVIPKELAELEEIEKAAGDIFKAENPVILVGSNAVRARASEALTEFATALKIPVVTTMMAKGMIPMDNPYAMYTIGIPQKDYQNIIIGHSDLVICIGYDIVEYAPQKWNPDGRCHIIHIDSRMAHINKLYQPDIEVIGDISDSLKNILNRTHRNTEPEEAFDIRKKLNDDYTQYKDDCSFPMKPQKILLDIRKFMGEEDILISDVGAHKMWIARHYQCYRPNTCIISNGFASMGIAVPGAIAAKLVNPDKKVLAVTGDGGFMMNSQELETALRFGIQFVTVIFKDSCYGLIKWKQIDQYGKSCYVNFSNPDFVKYAESMHCIGYRVEKAEDFYPILEKAFEQTVPVIIDCQVDHSENLKLTSHLQEIIDNNE